MSLPQFTFRDVLWLIVVVGIGFAHFVNLRATADANARIRSLQAKLKERDSPVEPTASARLSVMDQEQAIAVANAYLQDELKKGRVDDWGEPITVRMAEGLDVIVEYKTPPSELELLGIRSIRVHRDNWTAAPVLRH